MKKLLLLLPTLPAYREDFLTKLSESLKKEQVELYVLYGSTSARPILTIDKGQEYNTIKLKTIEKKIVGFNIITHQELYQTTKRLKPDGVIFLFNPGIISYWRVVGYCIFRKIPFGIWSCGYTRRDLSSSKVKFRQIFLDYFYRKAKVHIAYGSLHKSYLKSIGINENKIFIAQNTINVESILKNKYDYHTNKSISTPLHILFVGTMSKMKHLDTCMIAIDRLISEGYNITFNIVGKGNIIDELKKIHNTLKNKNNIIFLGELYGKELADFFLSSDVYLLAGNGGLAVNEAMAYGLPIISTIGDGTVGDLIDGNGFLLRKFGDIDEIYNTIETFLHLSEEERQIMRNKSVQIIRERATLENMVNKYMEAVNFLIEI